MKCESSSMTWLTWPVCNRRPATAPHWFGGRAPLCWRCLALSAGVCVGASMPMTIAPGLAALLLLPCIIDGGLHHLGRWRSSNRLRVATGLPAGLGLIHLAPQLVAYAASA